MSMPQPRSSGAPRSWLMFTVRASRACAASAGSAGGAADMGLPSFGVGRPAEGPGSQFLGETDEPGVLSLTERELVVVLGQEDRRDTAGLRGGERVPVAREPRVQLRCPLADDLRDAVAVEREHERQGGRELLGAIWI